MLTYLISYLVLGILINISGSKVDLALMNLKAIQKKIQKERITDYRLVMVICISNAQDTVRTSNIGTENWK